MSILNQDKVLIFAPHPDDEILGCSSVIKWAVKNNFKLNIIIVTNGENDITGGLLEFCKRRKRKVLELYVGLASVVTKTLMSLRKMLVVYIEDKYNNPIKGARVRVINERVECYGMTNELGWIIFNIHPGNICPEVKIELKDGTIFKDIDQMSENFLNKYGKIRLNESYAALKTLGVKEENIITWGYKDGSLSQLLSSHVECELLKKKISTVLNKFIKGTVITPHPSDIDLDHKTLAKIIQELSKGMDLDLYRYIIHSQIDHSTWPLPVFKNCIADRLSLEAGISCPESLVGEQYDTVLFSQVQMTSIDKHRLIQMYRSQCSVDQYGFLISFAKTNELFYKEE